MASSLLLSAFQTHDEGTRTEKQHILVVDDDQGIQASLAAFLRRTGFEVSTASDSTLVQAASIPKTTIETRSVRMINASVFFSALERARFFCNIDTPYMELQVIYAHSLRGRVRFGYCQLDNCAVLRRAWRRECGAMPGL